LDLIMSETRVSWLSSAGVIANGGIRPPGTEHLGSSTGRAKTGNDRPIKKASPYSTPVRADDADKPITGGRALTPGRYTHDGVEYIVKISKSSGKPYALVAATDVYAPGIARNLRMSDRTGDLDNARRDIPLGLYNVGDDIVLVRVGRNGHKFGSVLDRDTGRWVFTRGIMARIDVDNPATYGQVIAFGLETGECMICSKLLTNPKSIKRGIGPICAAKYGWFDVDTDPSAPAIELDATTDPIRDTFPATELADVDPTTIPGLTDKTESPIVDVTPVRTLSDDDFGFHPTGEQLSSTSVTGPVVTANGRLDHSGCGHPNTTAARTTCRNAFRKG
jgi:hypothetical protein